MKKRLALLLTPVVTLITLMAPTRPVYAQSSAPLPNMPTANDDIYTVVPDGAGGVYIGGLFTQLTPASGPAVTRNYIARINADGSIHAWDPNADSFVLVLAVSGGTVYAGGAFTNIGGQARNYIAALDAVGAATAWNPDADWDVYALAVSGGTVYAGGAFTNIGGQARNYIAALDAVGAATAWNPNANDSVFVLVVNESTVYVGGPFTNIGGQVRNRIAALNAAGNATAWDPNADDIVWALAVSGGTVYAGGWFTTIGGQARERFAAFGPTPSAALQGGDPGDIARTLPRTGFAPNVITLLPSQPAELAYSELGSLWLEIPSLKVKANIVGVPQSENAWDVKWLGQDAGWLNGTAFPTWEGNSVVTAHVTDANGKAGPFANLKDLKYGAQVIVHLFDQRYVFEVRNKRLVRPDSTDFAFEHLEDHSYLTLITCQSYDAATDSYRLRRIIRAVLVEVK